jgi:hypothetical protein
MPTVASVIACPHCREDAPDLIEVWRGGGFCNSCGRCFTLPQAPPSTPAVIENNASGNTTATART